MLCRRQKFWRQKLAAEEEQGVAAAAWVDEDDEDQLINVSGVGPGMSRLKKLRTSRAQRALSGPEYVAGLRRQFESVQPDVNWAELPPEPAKRKRRRKRSKGGGGGGDAAHAEESDDQEGEEGEEEGEEEDEEDETDAVLRSSGRLLGASSALPPGQLSVRRLTDLNLRERNSSITECVMWHPNGKLALTAGKDKTLRLFRTDGSENAKLQSIHVENMPIRSASFTPDGSQVLMCGTGKHW